MRPRRRAAPAFGMVRAGPGLAAARVAAVLAALVAAACGDGSGSSVEEARSRRYRDAAVALCAAADQAGPDLPAARATFYDRSHDALHAIATDLEPLDRALVARLLEAKQRVEAALDTAPSPPAAGLAADLRSLATVTRSALDRLSTEAGSPCS